MFLVTWKIHLNTFLKINFRPIFNSENMVTISLSISRSQGFLVSKVFLLAVWEGSSLSKI